MMHLLCDTAIPDEVVISLLVAIFTGSGAVLKFLWVKVNRLQDEVAKLREELAHYRSCPAKECPALESIERHGLLGKEART